MFGSVSIKYLSIKMESIRRLLRTVRYMKPIQIIMRFRLYFYYPKVDLGPSPRLRSWENALVPPATRRPSMSNADTFMFLNVKRKVPVNGWNSVGESELWCYNMHYFDDLNAFNAFDRRAWHREIIERWIRENPPGSSIGWDPYPTSLRIVNWIKYAQTGNTLSDEALKSLSIQTRWLSQRLEWHLLGNHLFANAKALLFAGCFFSSEESDKWLIQGLEILEREIKEQFLDDGGHFELSPMYHALGLEDLLDIVALSKATNLDVLNVLVKRCEITIVKAINWLKVMSHPDGRISFFNDTAFGIAPENDSLLAYAKRLGYLIHNEPNCEYLADSGYLRLETNQAVFLSDLASIGPNYIPGHAHADSLSFELSLFNERVIVNSGTSVYGVSDERLRQRGTKAHNTVCIDNHNSSEVWSGFRVGRRARTTILELNIHEAQLGFIAYHDGYNFLKGTPLHIRQVNMTQNMLLISDKVDEVHSAEARYHIHPDIVADVSGSEGKLKLASGRVITLTSGSPMSLEKSSWNSEFGKEINNLCLKVPLMNGEAFLKLDWANPA